MNNFDDWSQIISKYLKSETDPLNLLSKHDLEGDAARIAFIRSVLDRFLPEIYGVGSGQIMDSKGNMSGSMDIVIYRKDFPRLDLPGSRDTYLYESVIATFEVVTKLVKKTFLDALDQCAELAELSPDMDQKVIASLAVKNQLTMNENRVYVHPDPLRTARFELIGRPLSFIYAFNGYKTSPRQLTETIEAWMQERREAHKPVDMKSIPSVIATQGCFAWRNSAPYTVKGNCLMGVGVDQAPIRLIVLQMLHTLSRRLKVTADSFGLRPGLDGYLNRMPPPVMESFIGKAINPLVGEKAKAVVAKQVKPVAPAAKPVEARKEQTRPAIVSAKLMASVTNISRPASKKVSNDIAKVKPIDTDLEPHAQAKSEAVAALDSAGSFVESMKFKMSTPKNEGSSNAQQVSANEFLETVKVPLSNPEPFPHLQPKSEPEPEPFTSTIPQ